MSQQWLPEDTPPENDIKTWAEKVFESLNKLEEAVDAEYQERRNNPTLILQMQALRSTRNALNKAFPYPEDTNVEERSAGYPIGSTLPDDEGKAKIATSTERFPAESVLPSESEDKSDDKVDPLDTVEGDSRIQIPEDE